MKKNTILILLLIIIVGSFFRLFWITKSPPSLNWDEAALGYNSYSLLTTGKDEYGHKLPLVLRSFDDYKPALYSYLTAPFIAVFGLNELSVRLISVLSGVSIIFLVFLIARKLFDEKIGLISALFISIEPWAVHFSRAAFEANLGLALILTGIYFGLKIKENSRFIFPSVFFLGLSAYSYHAYKLLFLPIVFLFVLENLKTLKKGNTKIYFALTLVAILIPLFVTLKSGEGFKRLEATSIIKIWQKDQSVFSVIDNPVFNLGKEVVGRYFAYFSPANLFVRGTNEPNQKVHDFGIFYTLDILFYLIGFYFFAKNRFKPKILLYLILIAPLPATITWNWFAPVRTLLMFVLLPIIFSLGLVEFFKFLGNQKLILKSLITFALVVFYLNSILNLGTTLYLYMPYAEKGNWQYGFREILSYVDPISSKYDKIIFETGQGQPHIFTLFYSKYDPAKYHRDIVCPDCVEKPRKNFNFGKYNFRGIFWPSDRDLNNTLFIGSTYSLPEGDILSTKDAKILKDIYDERGDFVARVVEKK